MSLTRIGSIGINTGIAFAGVTTIVTLNTANDALSIGATVNVGSGITLGASGDIFATGVSTFSGNLKVGSGVTISPDGDGFFTGVITATSYSGIDLSDVTGATGDFSIADKIVHTGDTDTAIRFSGADTIKLETGGSERLKVDSTGDTIVSGTLFADSDLFVVDKIRHTGDTNTEISFPSADTIDLQTAGSSRIRVNSTGIGFHATSPNTRFQVGNATFNGGHGMYENGRVGMANHGNLTGLMLASTYNDAGVPEYGLVFVQGPTTSNYNCWSLSPDGPAKGNSLSLHYGAQNTNIHILSNRKFEFDGDGDFRLTAGNVDVANGYGIDFSANTENESGAGSSSGQLLDDYEEGTWTPTWDAPNQSSTTFGLNHQHGYYTKIGNLVHVTCYLQGFADANNGGGSNDDLAITGLPFTVANLPGGGNTRHAASFAVGSRYRMLVDDLILHTFGNTTEVRLFEHTSGNTMVRVKTNQITARGGTNECYFAGSYRVHA